jgi:hypothetical protein
MNIIGDTFENLRSLSTKKWLLPFNPSKLLWTTGTHETTAVAASCDELETNNVSLWQIPCDINEKSTRPALLSLSPVKDSCGNLKVSLLGWLDADSVSGLVKIN